MFSTYQEAKLKNIISSYNIQAKRSARWSSGASVLETITEVKQRQELEKTNSVVSSPLSAEFVLALLTLGTSEPTHSELLSALGIPNDKVIRSSFTSLTSKLKAIKSVTLNVANRVYIKDGPYELDRKMEKDAVKVFGAGIEKVDFGNSAAAANLINRWVESKTNKKIKDLISSDSLYVDTRLVLVSALYFKGTWKNPFKKNDTREQPFFVTPDTTVPVPMMYMESNFRYSISKTLDAQLLEMPYKGDEASMVVVLPMKVDGLNDVLKTLADGHDLIGDLDNMSSVKVQVSLPKFKIETEIDLIALLPKLGIKSIFKPCASGLDKLLKTKYTLYVSKAVQKAFIEVNEDGTEAAAATAIPCERVSLMIDLNPVKCFKADHPFLVAIVVKCTPFIFASHRGLPTSRSLTTEQIHLDHFEDIKKMNNTDFLLPLL